MQLDVLKSFGDGQPRLWEKVIERFSQGALSALSDNLLLSYGGEPDLGTPAKACPFAPDPPVGRGWLRDYDTSRNGPLKSVKCRLRLFGVPVDVELGCLRL